MDPHLASTDGNCPGNVGSATLKSRSGQFSSVASCCLESCLQVCRWWRGGGYPFTLCPGGKESQKCGSPALILLSCLIIGNASVFARRWLLLQS